MENTSFCKKTNKTIFTTRTRPWYVNENQKKRLLNAKKVIHGRSYSRLWRKKEDVDDFLVAWLVFDWSKIRAFFQQIAFIMWFFWRRIASRTMNYAVRNFFFIVLREIINLFGNKPRLTRKRRCRTTGQ